MAWSELTMKGAEPGRARSTRCTQDYPTLTGDAPRHPLEAKGIRQILMEESSFLRRKILQQRRRTARAFGFGPPRAQA
jgi:hypothetical protein